MLATTTKGEAAGRRNLRMQLVLERITQRSHERVFQSQAMRDGIDREAMALELYECVTGRLVQPVGYVLHDTLEAGCSLDGIVGDWEGQVEAKSPIPATHLEYLRYGVVPKDYLDQVRHGLWITGLPWCDWFSYQPDFEERLQIKLVRVYRDEPTIADYEQKVRAFLREVELEVHALRTMANPLETLQQVAS